MNASSLGSLAMTAAKSKQILLLNSYEMYLFLNGTTERDLILNAEISSGAAAYATPAKGDLKDRFYRGVKMVKNSFKVRYV